MLVDGVLGKAVLIPLEAFPEIVLHHQAAPDQEVQGAIDRRLGDATA